MTKLEINQDEVSLLVSMLEAGTEQVGSALSIAGDMIPKDDLAVLGMALRTMLSLSNKLVAARLVDCDVPDSVQ